ncbi:MAG: 4-hydroxy-tetrahydrodipicolinate reductase [Chitinivibrionales bacterium]|nr:4-hydroxy-tetrahydrodipicolinate reductase [Chitinivibrionales bacterium]
MTVPIIINGALGRMGAEIARCTLEHTACSLVGAVESPGHPGIGGDIGPALGMGNKNIQVVQSIDECALENAVVIDFSAPEVSMALLKALEKRSAKLVIGTTGFSGIQVGTIEAVAQEKAIVFSPNMSVGVNLLFWLTRICALKLHNEFDIEIIEAHHRFKKDAPSGTAKKLGEIAAEAMAQTYDEVVRNGRAGLTGERNKREIGMHAVRGGDIVGDHTVLFAGMGERIELRHVAHTRSALARGAVHAALWLFNQEPGLYSMAHVLGLEQ